MAHPLLIAGHLRAHLARTLACLLLLAMAAAPGRAQTALSGAISSGEPLVYAGPVVLTDDVEISAPSVTFQSTVDGTTDGAEMLTVTTTGGVRFEGAVGYGTAVGTMTLDGAGDVFVGANIRTRGTQRYDAPVVIGANVFMTASGTGTNNIQFNNTVDGDAPGSRQLVVTAYGVTIINGDVGTAARLKSLQVSSAGTVYLNAASIETKGLQNYAGPAYFNPAGSGTTTLTSATDRVHFRSTLDPMPGQNDVLVVDAAGGATFDGHVDRFRVGGAIRVLGDATVTDAATLELVGRPTVDGELALRPGATLAARLADGGFGPDTEHVSVGSALDVTDALLDVSLADGFSPAPGQQFVIADNAGTAPVVGTFAGLPEGASVVARDVTFTLSYVGGDGNDVTLTAAEALPIELGRLDAIRDGARVHVEWETLSETNAAHFDVETADLDAPGALRWRALGSVAAAGTSTTPRRYRFDAGEPAAGRHAYRLRQVDGDGRVHYSPRVEVAIAAEAAMLDAYPNPFNPATTLRFAAPAEGRVRVVLYDALGRQLRVLFDGTASTGGVQTVRLDASGLPSGTYFARLLGAGAPVTQTLLLTK